MVSIVNILSITKVDRGLMGGAAVGQQVTSQTTHVSTYMIL